MKKFLLLFGFLSTFALAAQNCNQINSPFNLVPNGDFEVSAGLPTSSSQFNLVADWSNAIPANAEAADYYDGTNPDYGIPVNWPSTTAGYADGIPDNCPGNSAYAGIIGTDSPDGVSEIIKTELTSPLAQSTTYRLQFDVFSIQNDTYSDNIRFEAFIGPDLQPLPNNQLPIDSNDDGIPDGNGIYLQQGPDVFANDGTDWEPIVFEFTTDDTADQQFLYLGSVWNPETQNETSAYALIDNVTLIPLCEGNPPPVSYPDVSLVDGEYSCSDLPTIMGTYTNPLDIDGSFADQPTIALEIFYGDGLFTTLTNPTTITQNNNGTGMYSFAISDDDVNPDFLEEHTFKVTATFQLSESCNPDAGTNEVSVSDQSNTNGPVIRADLFCCSNPQFSIVNFCPPIGCDGPICDDIECNGPSCDHPDGITGFRVIDSGGNIVNHLSYPGIEFEWTNTETGLTGDNFSFIADFNQNVSVVMSYNRCESETLSDILICGEPPACEDCEELADNIIASITEISCGQYTIAIPDCIFDNYDQIYFTQDIGDYQGNVLLTQDDINNGVHTFNYEDNGEKEVSFSLINGSSKCPSITSLNITCINDCPDVDNPALYLLESTDVCNEYRMHIPEEYFACFEIRINHNRLLDNFDYHTITESDLINEYYYLSYNYSDLVQARWGIKSLTSGNLLSQRTATFYTENCTRNENRNDSYELSLYPNPFLNQIHFKNPIDVPISKVDIYNSYGTRITSQPYTEGIPIRVDRGTPGLYFAKVFFENGTIETIELIKK